MCIMYPFDALRCFHFHPLSRVVVMFLTVKLVMTSKGQCMKGGGQIFEYLKGEVNS